MSSITDWNSMEMNWDKPNPDQIKYFEALRLAVIERCIAVDIDFSSLRFPLLENNNCGLLKQYSICRNLESKIFELIPEFYKESRFISDTTETIHTRSESDFVNELILMPRGTGFDEKISRSYIFNELATDYVPFEKDTSGWLKLMQNILNKLAFKNDAQIPVYRYLALNYTKNCFEARKIDGVWYVDKYPDNSRYIAGDRNKTDIGIRQYFLQELPRIRVGSGTLFTDVYRTDYKLNYKPEKCWVWFGYDAVYELEYIDVESLEEMDNAVNKWTWGDYNDLGYNTIYTNMGTTGTNICIKPQGNEYVLEEVKAYNHKYKEIYAYEYQIDSTKTYISTTTESGINWTGTTMGHLPPPEQSPWGFPYYARHYIDLTIKVNIDIANSKYDFQFK